MLEKYKQNWLLIVSYLLICAFIYEIWVAHQFYPYIYDYIVSDREVAVKNGIGEIVWGPYERIPNEMAHEDELRISFLVISIERTLSSIAATLLPIPSTIKAIKEKPTSMNQFGLIALFIVMGYLIYLYVGYVFDLQPYLY
ncbi:hypothetical protein FPQ10_06465 [Allobacillus sp. SKP2-8]|uniref:hypothetical protein n=1 Tax=unclassified Allobacillus TaxID=2628859 RepID=UPI0011844256|nr:hypothetical protein [Allobacillus sp. SKP2-8]TSJ66899.1 hypothetical protein FPQ10_06465 [Allobacillus sp. SKP2-8]